MNALINHPSVGSIWLEKATIKNGYVIGETWDNSETGSSYLSDDYTGQYITMSFPVTCIRKKENKNG